MRLIVEETGSEGETFAVTALGRGRYRVQRGDEAPEIVEAYPSEGGLFLRTADGEGSTVLLAGTGAQREAQCGAFREQLSLNRPSLARRRAKQSSLAGGGNRICSPMPGRVVQVLVSEGDEVSAGQGVVIVEAMKMENELKAERAGVIERVLISAGDLVEGGAELVCLV